VHVGLSGLAFFNPTSFGGMMSYNNSYITKNAADM